ncbi:hypothetical protein Tco_1085183 [Tanacetum coccineum]
MKAICNLDVHVDSKAPKPSSQTEEVPQGKKARAKSGLRRKQSSKLVRILNKWTIMKTEPDKTEHGIGMSTRKRGQSLKESTPRQKWSREEKRERGESWTREVKCASRCLDNVAVPSTLTLEYRVSDLSSKHLNVNDEGIDNLSHHMASGKKIHWIIA